MVALSNSQLWQKMHEYYDKLGPEVWQDEVVPSQITSNKYLANVYARLIITQINDYLSATTQESSHNDPFYILELGAGHGKFSYYLLKQLCDYLIIYNIPIDRICYLITDISENNLISWKNHPAFKEFIQMGILDFAIFNALDESAIHLREKNTTIHYGEINTPLFAIANYVFDTLKHDAFQIRKNKLYEACIDETIFDQKASSLQNIFEDAKFPFLHREVKDQYYDDPSLNKILAQYKDIFNEASFLMPMGAIQCIKNLQKFTNSSLTVLASDKGDLNTELFAGLEDPDIATHGSVSMSVNFDALHRYATHHQGTSLQMGNKNASFQVAMLIMNDTYPILQTRFMFESTLSAFSPQDLFNISYPGGDDEPNQHIHDLNELLSIMNLSHWDPDIFYDYHEQMLGFVEDNDITVDQDLTLYEGLLRVGAYFFKLEKNRDILFAAACILYQIDRTADAIAFYKLSVQEFGEQIETLYNLALAYLQAEDSKNAKLQLKRVVQLQADYEDAKFMLSEL